MGGASLEHDGCKEAATVMGNLRLCSTDPIRPMNYIQQYFIPRNIICAGWYLVTDVLFWGVKLNYMKDMVRWGQFDRVFFSLIGLMYDWTVVYVTTIQPLTRNIAVFLVLRLCLHFCHLFLLFYAQHYWDSNLSEETAESEWGKHNAETSVSLWGETMQWHPLLLGFGGTCPATLTYHLEHSLFPGINYLHLPVVARVTKQTCEEFGVTYHHLKDYSDLNRAFVNNAKRCAAVQSLKRD